MNDDQWSDKSASITCNVDAVLLIVDKDAYEFLYHASFSQESEILDKLSGLSVHTNRLTVEIYHGVLW